MLRAVSAKTGISVSMQTSLCVTARHEQVLPSPPGRWSSSITNLRTCSQSTTTAPNEQRPFYDTYKLCLPGLSVCV